MLSLASRLVNSDNTPIVNLTMKDTYPNLEPIGTIPEVQKKLLNAYDMVCINHVTFKHHVFYFTSDPYCHYLGNEGIQLPKHASKL